MITPDTLLATPRLMGARVKRIEDPRLITGHGQYVDDIPIVGLLHMAIVRSPYAHARIRAIEVAAARRMPGVVAVWTGEDVRHLGGLPLMPNPRFSVEGGSAVPQHLLTTGKVRFVGDPIVAVVADSRYRARDAALAVQVDYEPLPAVTDPAAALAPDAPRIHEDLPDNRAYRLEVQSGDLDAAFAQADRIVRGRFVQPRLVSLTMEPRATVAQWDPGAQKLTMWASVQGAHNLRGQVCRYFGLDETHVRVIAPDVGGGFGAKSGPYADELLVAWAAMRLQRPVKYLEDRRDHFVQTGHGRGQINEVEAAVRSDGALLGLRVRLLGDLGAYAGPIGPLIPTLTIAMGVGTYRVTNVHYDLTTVYTNATPTTAYRGAGRPEAAYLLERLMDLIAHDLGLDPAEVRRRNFIPPNAFPYRTPTRQTYDSGDYEAVLDLALQVADYPGLRRWQAEQRAAGRIVGIGLSTYVEISGGGPTLPNAARGGFESATVRVEPTGAVTVLTGASPHGQGTATSFAQIVADALGVPMEKVQVIHGDTEKVQLGHGTGGSRVMATGGTVLLHALTKVRDKAQRIAAAMLEANPEDITLDPDSGRFVVRGSPDRGLTLADIARKAYVPYGLPRDLEPGLEAQAFWEPENFAFPFGCHVVVVEVDRDTGKVRVLRYLAVDDVGKVISPRLMEGQVHGGVAQGLAAALYEGVEYDERGQLVTATLMDYAALKADDLPSIQVVHHATPTTLNPLGAKGVGESGTVGATPAVVNAVLDALRPFGVRNLDMPLKPEKVWRAIQGTR